MRTKQSSQTWGRIWLQASTIRHETNARAEVLAGGARCQGVVNTRVIGGRTGGPAALRARIETKQ